MSDDTGIKRIVGPTILLRSGSYFDFDDPETTAASVTLHDIATGLSQLCRFTGQCHTFYSVAEHSVHCSYLVPPEDAFAALMHDAAEAVMGDVSRPLKSMLPEYKRIERRVEAAILTHFGLPPSLPPTIKQADIWMLAAEQRQAMLNTDRWPGIDGHPQERELWFLSPPEAYARFIQRFHEVAHV